MHTQYTLVTEDGTESVVSKEITPAPNQRVNIIMEEGEVTKVITDDINNRSDQTFPPVKMGDLYFNNLRDALNTVKEGVPAVIELSAGQYPIDVITLKGDYDVTIQAAPRVKAENVIVEYAFNIAGNKNTDTRLTVKNITINSTHVGGNSVAYEGCTIQMEGVTMKQRPGSEVGDACLDNVFCEYPRFCGGSKKQSVINFKDCSFTFIKQRIMQVEHSKVMIDGCTFYGGRGYV